MIDSEIPEKSISSNIIKIINFIDSQAGVLSAIIGIVVLAYIFRAKLDKLDERVRYIVYTMLTSLFVSIFIYNDATMRREDSYFYDFIRPETFSGAAFAGWVGSIAFFLVIGLAVAIFSLAQPENESFETRARILFRRQSGRHINYILSRIGNLFEQYSELNRLKIIIESIDWDNKFMRMGVEEYTQIRSYIDDTNTVYTSRVDIEDAKLNPGNPKKNRLVYLRVNSESKTSKDFETNLSETFSTEIQANETCVVEERTDFWFAFNEERYEHAPCRYTQNLEVSVENLLSEEKVHISIGKESNDTSETEFNIKPGNLQKILIMSDLLPKKVAFAIKITPVANVPQEDAKPTTNDDLAANA
jgi:hypothetical protein